MGPYDPLTSFFLHNHHSRAHGYNTSTTIGVKVTQKPKQPTYTGGHIGEQSIPSKRSTGKQAISRTIMSRELVPYGNGRGTSRDLVSYESGHVSPHPQRESTRDSRAHQTTAHSQTFHRDDYPYGSERVSVRPGRESTRDSRSRQTTTCAYTPPQGHTPHRTSAPRDSHTNTNYSIKQGVAEGPWQLDEAYYSNDGHTITQRARYSNLTQDSTTEFEVRETPTSRTRIRTITRGSHRSPDVHFNDDTSREHNTHRPGSSYHHTNTGSTRRDTLTSSRDKPRRTAGGHGSIYDESRSSTRR